MLGRSWFARVFGSGENPLRWAIPLYTLAGIAVKVHVLFVIFIVARLLFTLAPDTSGVGFVLAILVPLFVLVLLHEYGHCLACRRTGGEADEIILWPLGGLAACRPPHDWLSHLVTTVGGPAVNAALLPILGVTAWLAVGDWRAAVFNPFDPASAFATIQAASSLATWTLITLVGAHVANTYLLLFNILVPMYPMDGGRILHALIWRRAGHYKATETATLVGMITAGALAVVGVVFNETMLLAIAVFGGLVSWQTRRSERFAETGGYDAAVAQSQRLAAEEQRERAEARKAREAAAKKQEEIDRILAKISERGIDSLTKKEKRALDEASARDEAAPR